MALAATPVTELAERYARLRLAIVGDFCLDRDLEIDPAREEISLETGLPVHNVVNVRSQPDGSTLDIANGLKDLFEVFMRRFGQ